MSASNGIITPVVERTKTGTSPLHFAILAMILILAAILRLHRIGQGSFWFDERASVMSSTGNFADWQNMPLNQVISPAPDFTSVTAEKSWLNAWRSPDSHPPLYAILLRGWRRLVGESDAAVRTLSVCASLASIIFLFDIAATLGSARIALWACAIMAVAQPQIQYAQEARGYALWSALALAAGSAAARLYVLGPRRRRAVALIACVSAMLLTHFLAIGTALALVVWCAIYLRGRALRQTAIFGAVAFCALCVIAIGLARQDYGTQHNTDWLRQDSHAHIAATFWNLALLPSQFLAEPNPAVQWAAVIGAVIYILPWLMRGPLAIFCGLWLIGGIGLVFCLDLFTGTSALKFIRFTLVAAPAVYLLIAAMPVRGLMKTILPLSAVLCASLTLSASSSLSLKTQWNQMGADTTWKGQWRELGADVRRFARPGDILVFASRQEVFLADPRKLYEAVSYYDHPIPCPVVLLDAPADSALQTQLQKANHVWIVFPDGAGRLSDYLPGWTFSSAAPKRQLSAQLFAASSKIPP